MLVCKTISLNPNVSRLILKRNLLLYPPLHIKTVNLETKCKQRINKKKEEISKSIYMILFIHVYDDASQLKVTITTIIFIFPKTKTCLRLN